MRFLVALFALCSLLALTFCSPDAGSQDIPRHNPADKSHWYGYECCALNDCAMIPDGNVKITDKGYIVTVRVGEHPMFKSRSATFFVPHGNTRIKPSKDFGYHLCGKQDTAMTTGIAADGDPKSRLICLYTAPLGF